MAQLSNAPNNCTVGVASTRWKLFIISNIPTAYDSTGGRVPSINPLAKIKIIDL